MRLRCKIGWHEYKFVEPSSETLSQAIRFDLLASLNMELFRCIHCGKETCGLKQEARERMAEYWKEHRWDFSMKSVDGLVDTAFSHPEHD